MIWFWTENLKYMAICSQPADKLKYTSMAVYILFYFSSNIFRLLAKGCANPLDIYIYSCSNNIVSRIEFNEENQRRKKRKPNQKITMEIEKSYLHSAFPSLPHIHYYIYFHLIRLDMPTCGMVFGG